MNVLIVGANGITGHHIVRHMMDSDHNPIAMIRDKNEALQLQKMGAQVIVADLEQDISHAFENVDAVIFAAGAGAGSTEHKTNMIDRDGAIKMIHEAEKRSLKKFVMLSAIGADVPDQADEVMKVYMQAKHDADKALKRSNLDYTIVRAGKLSNDEGTQAVKLGEHISASGQEVPRDDVALVLVSSLDDPRVSRKSFELTHGKKTIDEAFEGLATNK